MLHAFKSNPGYSRIKELIRTKEQLDITQCKKNKNEIIEARNKKILNLLECGVLPKIVAERCECSVSTVRNVKNKTMPCNKVYNRNFLGIDYMLKRGCSPNYVAVACGVNVQTVHVHKRKLWDVGIETVGMCPV